MTEKLQIRLAQGFLLLVGIGICSQIDFPGYVMLGKVLLGFILLYTTLFSIAFLWTKSEEEAEKLAAGESRKRMTEYNQMLAIKIKKDSGDAK